MAEAAEKKEQVYVEWDVGSVCEDWAKAHWPDFMSDGLTEEEAKKAALSSAWKDHDMQTWAWSDVCEALTELMRRIQPDGDRWHVSVEGFGWRNQSGSKDVSASDGRSLLQQILPKTECTFKVFLEEDELRLQNWHHDSPTGNEWYTIKPALGGR